MGRKPMAENELYATGEQLLQAVSSRISEMTQYPRLHERKEAPTHSLSGLEEQLGGLRDSLTDARYEAAGVHIDCIIYHLAHLIAWTEAREPKKERV
jgi:hypothetical protein